MPQRFTVRYRLAAADAAEALTRAESICVEQTVEFPLDLLPDAPLIHQRVLGRLESLEPHDNNDKAFEAAISYDDAVASADLPQLLNVIFGNTSIKPGIRVERLELGGELVAGFGGGPRFGQAGLRRLLGAERRPLLCTALKPMGLGPAELARIAGRCAEGGIDLIKDDHGLADQPFCRFRERVARCAEAVAEANANSSSGQSLYVPNVSGPADRIADRVATARRLGAGAVLVAPGLVGWDAMRWIASTAELPVICHPALLGSYVASPHSGIAHRVLLGELPRLAGADATIFPHVGGRFAFSEADCRGLVAGATGPLAELASSFPVPAGGLGLHRVPEVCDFYGGELILLIGGDLHRGSDLTASCRDFRRSVESWAARPTP